MVDRPARPDVPWWEHELSALRRELYEFLVRRLPALRAQHDDLVNDTLLDLSERVRAREGLPASWFGDGRDLDEAARQYFVRLGMTILRRRVADGFRGTAKRWAQRSDDASLQLTASDDPSAVRGVLVARMLRVCVETLADASDYDRALLASAIGLGDRTPADATDGNEPPLDARDRQRLKRLRDRLAAEIRRRLGDDVATLLREED